MNNDEIIDLENAPSFPEYYPAINHSMSAIKAAPFIRDIMYFKLQTVRNAEEIIDVA